MVSIKGSFALLEHSNNYLNINDPYTFYTLMYASTKGIIRINAFLAALSNL